jgi:Mg-chelatase subunit ChlD
MNNSDELLRSDYISQIRDFLLRLGVIIIMDDSGSMGEPASNSEEALGFSRNDFSRQGAKLCVNGALDEMCVGVIKFNSDASVVHSPVKISSVTRQGLVNKINDILPNGGTQIFSAMQEAKKMADQMKELYGITKVHIILFTDGEDGTLSETNVESYLSRLKVSGEYPFTMDTVGFGPNANTQLLVRMASLCGGTYALCYDASMVGTIFGRAIARTYLGSEAYGIHELDGPKSTDYYRLKNNYDEFRLELSRLLLNSYRMLDERVAAVNAFNSKLEVWLRDPTNQPTEQTNPDWYGFVCGLHADLNDQIRMAVSDPNFWTKWGKAYWQMVGIALDKQYSPNFKDNCLQIFGSPIAKAEYERISQIYDEMPMPPPSNRYLAATRSTPAPTTSAAFNYAGSGCFHQKACALLSTGEYVGFEQIEQMVKEGKRVVFISKNRANPELVELECLIKTDRRGMKTTFCKIDSLVLTPTHPVFYEDRWAHPRTIVGRVYEEYVDCVYNVVLKPVHGSGARAQSINVDGYECVGLAHGITWEQDPVAHDTFWGSETIVDAIKALYSDQYSSGLVNFTHQFKRNELTGFIDSIELSNA